MHNRRAQSHLPQRERGPFSKSSLPAEAEQEIISYLSINDIIYCAQVHHTWRPSLLEAIKVRKNCVTVYTWQGRNPSSQITHRAGHLGTQSRLGHSALRTYRGGPDGRGEYVSFYPGNCSHPACRESNSHFHTANKELGWQEAIPIDLYELDVDAINHQFQTMHVNMRSRKPWLNQHNCSDVVLRLLEQGGLFKKNNARPYSLVAMVISLVWSDTFLITVRRILSEKSKEIAMYELAANTSWSLLPKLITNLREFGLFAGIYALDMLIRASTMFGVCYLYAWLLLYKSDLPPHVRGRMAKEDAGICSYANVLAIILSILAKERDFPHPVSLADNVSHFIHPPLLKVLARMSPNNVPIRLALLFIVITVFIPLGLFYSTTATPNHVLKIIRPIADQLKKDAERKKSVHNTPHKKETRTAVTALKEVVTALKEEVCSRKYTTLSITAGLIAVGLFTVPPPTSGPRMVYLPASTLGQY